MPLLPPDEDNEEMPIPRNSVRYLDGSGLARPFRITGPYLFVVVAFIIAAVIIGGLLLFKVLDSTIYAAERQKASLEETISREVALELPILSDLITLDDADIRENLTAAGHTLVDRDIDEDGTPQSFDLVKLPEGVSVDEARLAYLQGINSLDSIQAVRLLKGSWEMTVDRTEGVLTMKVKYADFDSDGVDEAIKTAIASQGWTEVEMKKPEADAYGNTLSDGKMKVDGKNYNVKVSTCPLSGIYSVDGVPDSVSWVVITMSR